MEELAAPNTTRLPPLDRTGETQLLDRANTAQRLRELDVSRGLSEPEIGIVHLARQSFRGLSADRSRRPAYR
jgi:hypothetical protein